MAGKPKFARIHILIADNDLLLARALASNLRAMGFVNIEHVRNGKHALEHIKKKTVDLLITEWEMEQMDGLELIKHVRELDSAKRTLPIIMLTGKAEIGDISVARDTGITEFVIKPFTSKTLFHRIEQIAEHPRGFVLSETYTGPDRRRRVPPEETGERRTKKPVQFFSADQAKGADQLPALVLPDGNFKKNLGIKQPLSAMITPKVLADAQKAIDDIADESVKWLNEDIKELYACHSGMQAAPNDALFKKARETALSIKSRAGTFGYPMASEAARHLYLFLCSEFLQTRQKHLSLLEKYIQTIQVMIAQAITQKDEMGVLLLQELKRLQESL